MKQRVAQRKPRGKARPVAAAQQRAQYQKIGEALRRGFERLVQETLQTALDEEVTALLGRAKYARRRTGPQRPAGVRCSRCGLDWAARLRRDGHYARLVLTRYAVVAVRIPRLRCVCGG